MDNNLSALTAFHLTGERPSGALDQLAQPDLRPALFSTYRDLRELRYDFPLVLVNGDSGGGFVRSLSDIVDGILQDRAPEGVAGERLRQHLLKLETAARSLVANNGARPLNEVWSDAERRLQSDADATTRQQLDQSLAQARDGLSFGGEVIDCDRDMPTRLITHAWTASQQARARGLGDKLGDLVLKLNDILNTDAEHIEAAVGPEKLKRTVGKSFEAEFDFGVMSRLLQAAPASDALPEARCKRINKLLSVFKAQRFLPLTEQGRKAGRRKAPYAFAFDSCEGALEAIQERLPEMAKLVKALAIAELEIANRYDPSKHDHFFRHFSHRQLHAEDFALFPSYLVCLHGDDDNPAERSMLWQALSSGLPVKVLVQYDDVLGADHHGGERLSAGIKGPQLAAMALGLGDVFVLQSSSAFLYRLRDSLGKGLASDGPALFSVYSGAPSGGPVVNNNSAAIAPYLKAAAATESRAFPGYIYDPQAGADWASRFRLEANPQAQADWAMRALQYEDSGLQRDTTDIAFTFIDFAACDERYANHFAQVPQSNWHDGMIPVQDFLDLDSDSAAAKVPYVWMINGDDALYRAIVEDSLIGAARQCRDKWRSLQEFAGINNSHAEALFVKEREVWHEEKERELDALRGQTVPAGGGGGAETPSMEPEATTESLSETAGETSEEAPEEKSSDEPYIETPRCTTCNECTELNARMFAYNDELQAYILDPEAGTYREMVEAAEACQVAIIHPGKPKNASEPGLSDLVARAEEFD
ncbi:MAG: hypothetical protein HOM52_09805 [Rhodospirillaceae bacterium]|nr:hypothetical protein [Rhodospirillaceae bacterium]MBT5780487.1 hypothetical protein [Rhodospirillaceae bacterium]